MSSFRREIEANEKDLLVRVSKHTATDFLMLSNSENVSVYADRSSIKSGRKAILKVAKGTKATIEFPVYPKILQMSGLSYRRSGNHLKKESWA